MGNVEAAHVEKELGLEHELEFEFNEQKGFNCLIQPQKFCLSDAKGRPSTIDKRAKLKKEISILEEYFKPQMMLLFKLIFPDLSVDQFCSDLDSQRFQWLRKRVFD